MYLCKVYIQLVTKFVPALSLLKSKAVRYLHEHLIEICKRVVLSHEILSGRHGAGECIYLALTQRNRKVGLGIELQYLSFGEAPLYLDLIQSSRYRTDSSVFGIVGEWS